MGGENQTALKVVVGGKHPMGGQRWSRTIPGHRIPLGIAHPSTSFPSSRTPSFPLNTPLRAS